jgi:hypothetical protein
LTRGTRKDTRFGVGPWIGARVASQHCPVLRPGQGNSSKA